jgi:hypothetical protein
VFPEHHVRKHSQTRAKACALFSFFSQLKFLAKSHCGVGTKLPPYICFASVAERLGALNSFRIRSDFLRVRLPLLMFYFLSSNHQTRENIFEPKKNKQISADHRRITNRPTNRQSKPQPTKQRLGGPRMAARAVPRTVARTVARTDPSPKSQRWIRIHFRVPRTVPRTAPRTALRRFHGSFADGSADGSTDGSTATKSEKRNS